MQNLRLAVTEIELQWITEALENFVNECSDSGIDEPGMHDLFKRIEARNCKVQGEPEEGY